VRRAFGLAVVASFATLALGCDVGDGSGTAIGTLFAEGCLTKNADKSLQAYDLKPTFFAGEPIEDVCPPPGNCPGEHTNRLLIRMQRTGNRIEVNDTLYIDVQNAGEVARCLRGSTKDGKIDWDTRAIAAPDGTLTNLPFCDWNASAAGGSTIPDGGATSDGGAAGPIMMTAPRARINISTLDYVRASLAPLFTCYEQRLVGVAVPGSYIEFEQFGHAMQPELPAAEREPIGLDFKVDFGETLKASFHLVLEDQRVTTAQKNRDAVPMPRIGGELNGSFYFYLNRSRAAQPFP
jgi:hypothetical protein